MNFDFEQYIISKNDKVKGLQTKTSPNGDLELIFKIGRKGYSIKLENLDYETIQADINVKKEYEWLPEYHNKIRESHAEITKEYKDRIEVYNKEVGESTDTFMKEAIDKYFIELK